MGYRSTSYDSEGYLSELTDTLTAVCRLRTARGLACGFLATFRDMVFIATAHSVIPTAQEALLATGPLPSFPFLPSFLVWLFVGWVGRLVNRVVE